MRKKFVLCVCILGLIQTLSFQLNVVANTSFLCEYNVEDEVELQGSLLTGKRPFISLDATKGEVKDTIRFADSSWSRLAGYIDISE